MALLMGFHISFSYKPLAAVITVKGLVLLVNIDVRLQIGLLREAFAAVIGTFVRLSSQVKLVVAL